MGVKEDFFRLKAACLQAKGDDSWKSGTRDESFLWFCYDPEDQKELQAAIDEDFARIHQVVEDAKKMKRQIEVRKILSEVLPFISVSEFAKQYFDKSASWLHNALMEMRCMGK